MSTFSRMNSERNMAMKSVQMCGKDKRITTIWATLAKHYKTSTSLNAWERKNKENVEGSEERWAGLEVERDIWGLGGGG